MAAVISRCRIWKHRGKKDYSNDISFIIIIYSCSFSLFFNMFIMIIYGRGVHQTNEYRIAIILIVIAILLIVIAITINIIAVAINSNS